MTTEACWCHGINMCPTIIFLSLNELAGHIFFLKLRSLQYRRPYYVTYIISDIALAAVINHGSIVLSYNFNELYKIGKESLSV